MEKRLQSASISDCNARGDDALAGAAIDSDAPGNGFLLMPSRRSGFRHREEIGQQTARKSSALLRVAAVMHVA